MNPPIVLLHGLGRSHRSLAPLARHLAAAGFTPINLAYPSRRYTIEMLAAGFVLPAIRRRLGPDPGRIHFVTHSLGGIIVRQLAATSSLPIGRVVMLAPPNGGSELVDRFGRWPLFRRLAGPAGCQLGTAPDAPPRALGPAPFTLGIIAGGRSVNPLLAPLIPGRNDGRVSVTNAALAGMTDFLIIPASHPFVMRHRTAVAETIHFLRHGFFHSPPAPSTVKMAV